MTKEAFLEGITDRYYSSVYRFVRRICKDAALSLDITQEIFLIAWKKADELQHYENIQAWLYQTAHYRILYTLRETRQYLEWSHLADKLEDDSIDEDNWILRVDLYKEMEKYIKPEELELLLLHYEVGYSHRELAKKYDSSEMAIRKRISRMRQKLRNFLPDFDL